MGLFKVQVYFDDGRVEGVDKGEEQQGAAIDGIVLDGRIRQTKTVGMINKFEYVLPTFSKNTFKIL